MSHEIEIKEDGSASYFGGRGKTAWHGLGTTIEGLATAEQALKLAQLDWDVEKVPTYVRVGGSFQEINDAFAIIRKSDNKVLSRVGGDYVPCQNREAFSFLDSLVDAGEAIFDSAASLFGGRRVFVSVLLPETIQIGGEDTHEMYALVSNSHDGSTKLTCHATPVRTVCRNTQIMAFGSAKQSWGIRHTSGLEAKIVEAREALQLTFAYAKNFQAEAEELLKVNMTDQKFEEIVRGLFPESQKLQFDKNVTAVVDNWKHSETLSDDMRKTGWGAYNAITEWLSWGRSYRNEEARVKGVLFGQGAQIANKAAERLLAIG